MLWKGWIRISEPDALKVPFIFEVGNRVRVKSDYSISGIIKDGWFEGEYPSGSYQVWYEIETQDSQLFSVNEMELEKMSED
jgi:hypothetical protein